MCALCETFFTQESFRGCEPRRPTKVAGQFLQRPAHRLSTKSHFRWCRHEKERCSFSELCAKMIAGLRSPRPRLLSFHEESNQRRAKEEVSSLETPLRGRPHLCFLHCPAFLCAVPRMGKAHSPNFSAEKLLPSGTSQAKFSPPVCSGSGRMSGHSRAASGSRYLR